MPVYDPAWDMPQVNWQQQGSFESGEIPPAVAPDQGTQVCIPVAQEWLPLIVGCLDQLRNPSTWIVADDDAMYQVLQRADRLREIIATATCGGGTPEMQRFQNCVLQTSVDGGTTWTDVPGWAAGFGQCVRDNVPPPIPPNPGVDPIQQHACNIAGFLATVMLKNTLNAMVAYLGTVNEGLSFAQQVLNNLARAFPLTTGVYNALYAFYQDVRGQLLANVNSTLNDAALWSLYTCTVYQAIKAVGYVDATNYAAVGTALHAIPYPQAWAINAVGNYWQGVGLGYIQQLQNEGALDVVDCTGCGTACYQFDFSAGPSGWAINSGACGFGTYSGPNLRFESTGPATGCLPGSNVLNMIYNFGKPVHFAGMVFEIGAGDVSPLSSRRVQGYLAGSLVFSINSFQGAHAAPYLDSITHSDVIDQLIIFGDAATPSIYLVTRVAVDFNGPNPIGPNNCTI